MVCLFQIRGVNVSHPVVSFAHFGFDERLMKTLRKSEFTTPTPIQSQVHHSLLSIRSLPILILGYTQCVEWTRYHWYCQDW